MEEKSKIGERAFASLCDTWHYEYLQIHQSLETMSSAIIVNLGKRPDYLVNISDVGPIFVEVKTYKTSYVKEKFPFPKEPAFGENHEKYDKMRRFEKSMGLNVWYAFFEDKGSLVDTTNAYLCPVSRMWNFIPTNCKENYKKLPFFYVPIRCMNRCQDSLDLSNKCLVCRDDRCRLTDITH